MICKDAYSVEGGVLMLNKSVLYTQRRVIVTTVNIWLSWLCWVTLTTPLSSPVVMVFAFTTWSEYIGDLQE